MARSILVASDLAQVHPSTPCKKPTAMLHRNLRKKTAQSLWPSITNSQREGTVLALRLGPGIVRALVQKRKMHVGLLHACQPVSGEALKIVAVDPSHTHLSQKAHHLVFWFLRPRICFPSFLRPFIQ